MFVLIFCCCFIFSNHLNCECSLGEVVVSCFPLWFLHLPLSFIYYFLSDLQGSLVYWVTNSSFSIIQVFFFFSIFFLSKFQKQVVPYALYNILIFVCLIFKEAFDSVMRLIIFGLFGTVTFFLCFQKILFCFIFDFLEQKSCLNYYVFILEFDNSLKP